MRIFLSLIAIVGAIASIGCQSNPIDAGVPLGSSSSVASTSLPDSPTQAINTPDRINATMTKMPERVPSTEVTTPVTGEVPNKLLDAILTDLAKNIGVTPEKVAVIQAQAVVWNDGSLGCAKPGEFYTQALVNGYWVVLEVGNQKYDYRVADTGYFFLCEGGFPPHPQNTPNS